MPHLLIAGSTGSGKSVCVNTILISMLYQNSPEELKLILVDPKRVELTPYNGIPHLLADVIVENGKVLSALKWAIGEMDRRYKLLQGVGSKDIASFNKKAENGELFTKVNPETGEITEETVEKIPYIVIVIDELADLMASHGKEVEGAIIRLAQMARAIGIHLILSTQKPIVTVITSLIKSNIPTRIAFRVPSLMDSRTILDASGAEKLLGNGDMLFSAAEAVDLRRVQGVFVSEEEVKRVVDFIKTQKFEKIEDSLEDEIDIAETPVRDREGNGEVVTSYAGGDKLDFADVSSSDHEDPLYEEAKKIILQAGKASSSLLQRRLRVGYSRAARLVDMLEEHGIIGPADGAKPREVLAAGEQTNYDDHVSDQVARDKWQM
jgi:S-DNA-T family DNA segregation ATPase FtsK/SpoIIIE